MDNTLWSRPKSPCTSNLPFFWQSTERRDSCAAIAKANKKCILDKTKPCLQRDLRWSDVYLQANSKVINILEPILPSIPRCSCIVLNDDWIQGCCCPPHAHLCLCISNTSWYWGDRSAVTLLPPFYSKAIKTSFKSISLHWVLKVLVNVFKICSQWFAGLLYPELPAQLELLSSRRPELSKGFNSHPYASWSLQLHLYKLTMQKRIWGIMSKIIWNLIFINPYLLEGFNLPFLKEANKPLIFRSPSILES